MKLTDKQLAYVKEKASQLAIEPAMLLAVIEKESAGVFGSLVNGSMEPTIRYEGHYFDKLCKASVRDAARAAGVSAAKAGVIKNPKSQANRWSLMLKAASFDPSAAYQSCSWGIGQVMGSHWKFLGYPSINAFVSVARSGFNGQLDLMVIFIQKNGLVLLLRERDFSAFARKYNGPNYRANNYDTELERLYKKHGGVGAVSTNRSGYLRMGSKGAGVRDLQAMLKLSGYDIAIDGDFGGATDGAIRSFQIAHGLKGDGIVGPLTNAALTTVRDTAPANAGQEKVQDITEVRVGGAVGIGIPVILGSLEKELTSLVAKLVPYDYFSGVVEVLNAGINIVSVAAIGVGLYYAVRGWNLSKESYTGTKNDGAIAFPIPVAEGQRIDLPLAN